MGKHPRLEELFNNTLSKPPPRVEWLADSLRTYLREGKMDEDNLFLALRGVLVFLTGKDENWKNYDNPDSIDQLFQFVNVLVDETKTPFLLECKSGNDRTALAAALAVARKQYEEEYKKVYRMDYDNENEQKLFAYLWRQVVLDFGVPTLIVSRGKSKDNKVIMKSGGNPIYKKYWKKPLPDDRVLPKQNLEVLHIRKG